MRRMKRHCSCGSCCKHQTAQVGKGHKDKSSSSHPISRFPVTGATRSHQGNSWNLRVTGLGSKSPQVIWKSYAITPWHTAGSTLKMLLCSSVTPQPHGNLPIRFLNTFKRWWPWSQTREWKELFLHGQEDKGVLGGVRCQRFLAAGFSEFLM